MTGTPILQVDEFRKTDIDILGQNTKGKQEGHDGPGALT